MMDKYWKNRVALETPNGLGYQNQENYTSVNSPYITEVQQVDPEIFMQARSKTKRPQFLTPYTEQQLSEFELYLLGQNVGYAITPQKELVNVFNNSNVPGAGAAAVIDAISKGAKVLCCYAGFLCDYYRKFGFIETARRKWNDKFAPENWDFISDGHPDIVHMKYSGDRGILRLRHPVIGARRRQTAIDEDVPMPKYIAETNVITIGAD